MARFDKAKLQETGQRLVEQLLEIGINGAGPIKGAEIVADEHLRSAGGDREKAIRKLISTHVRLAAAGGAVTGVGGLLTMPITVPASATGLYVISTRMAAGIAHLRGYDVHSEEVRSAILVSLLGAGAAATLSKVGVDIGRKSTAAALKKVPGRLLIEINKKVGYRLLTKAGQTGAIQMSKAVPIVGAGVGATIDGASCKSISMYALGAFGPVDAHEAPPLVVDSPV